MISFADLGIREDIRRGLDTLGFTAPTPIQERIIPMLLAKGDDIVGLAQTGTGKTAAFGIPMIQHCDVRRNRVQALVLCPTRELCMQVAKDLNAFARFVDGVRVAAVYGGAAIVGQIKELQRGAQIIVATPGRLNDLMRRRAVDLSAISTLVLDEADEMLQMGFQEELTTILAETPADKSTLLFSATMPKGVATIARNAMRNPVEVTVGQRNAGTEQVRHLYYMVRAKDRYPALRRIIDVNPGIYSIIFCRTKQEVQDVAARLVRDGYDADTLHGDLSQTQRDQAMGKFREKHVRLLVATDVAARGLDVNDLTHVINYNLPDDIANYTHRSGRTGRAGKSGVSIVIIHLREQHVLRAIESRLKRPFERRQIPSGQEVCAKQLIRLIDTMHEVAVDHARIDPFLPEIMAKLAGLDREELIKRFVSVEFNRFLDYYKDAPDLNANERERFAERERPGTRAGETGGYEKVDPRLRFTQLTLNVGKEDGIHAARLIGQINETMGRPSVKIGKIRITDHATMLEADSRFAHKVAAVFAGTQINGRKVEVETGRSVASKPAWVGAKKGMKPGGFVKKPGMKKWKK